QQLPPSPPPPSPGCTWVSLGGGPQTGGVIEYAAVGNGCYKYPQPALLNLGGFYAATPSQAASLQILVTQAISNTIADPRLLATDPDTVKSWAREDADAELYGLLVQAIQTPAASRTVDQQNAYDWIAAVEQRQAVIAAQDAGAEYLDWAGSEVYGGGGLVGTK